MSLRWLKKYPQITIPALVAVLIAVPSIVVPILLSGDGDRKPEVVNVGPPQSRPGQEIDISGKNLDLVSGVLLTKGSLIAIPVAHIPISETRLIVVIPETVQPDTYNLEFKINSGAPIATGHTIIVNPPTQTSPSPTPRAVATPTLTQAPTAPTVAIVGPTLARPTVPAPTSPLPTPTSVPTDAPQPSPVPPTLTEPPPTEPPPTEPPPTGPPPTGPPPTATPFVDLSVSSFFKTRVTPPGKHVDASVTVTNSGTLPISHSQVKFTLSNEDTGEVQALGITPNFWQQMPLVDEGTIDTGSLEPSETNSFKPDLEIPENITPGAYRICAVAQTDEPVEAEEDAQNNTSCGPLEVAPFGVRINFVAESAQGEQIVVPEGSFVAVKVTLMPQNPIAGTARVIIIRDVRGGTDAEENSCGFLDVILDGGQEALLECQFRAQGISTGGTLRQWFVAVDWNRSRAYDPQDPCTREYVRISSEFIPRSQCE